MNHLTSTGPVAVGNSGISVSGDSGDSGVRISRRAQAVAPFYAMEFGKQAAMLEAQGHHVVKLSLGEPDFGAPRPY